MKHTVAWPCERILCAIPIPRYVAGRCCNDQVHLDNLVDDDIGEIHDVVRANSRSRLLIAFPIFETVSGHLNLLL